MAKLFPNIKDPSPLQEHASICQIAEGPQMFIFEESTGTGKTEAALVLAHRLIVAQQAEGLFIGLPTQATANAMYQRLARAYQRLYNEPASLVLAHSSRHLSEDFRKAIRDKIGFEKPPEEIEYLHDESSASAQCAAWLADNRKKSLLAAVGVGTLDQALLSVLPSNHQALRLFGLASKVLIIDEVHAYDVYMHKLLCILLEFQAALGGSAILLSATLPQYLREDLTRAFQNGLGAARSNLCENPGYPWVTHISSTLHEIPIATRPGTTRKIAIALQSEPPFDLIERLMTAGHCVCWIRNTVDDAIEAYLQLKERLKESPAAEKILLFHARFAMGDRLDIEHDVLKYFGPESNSSLRYGRVLIATQVVEQSLDLDFDWVISDLAPIDLLVQRAGREHRHTRDREGNPIYGEDQREAPIFTVISPGFTLAPESNWFSSFAPRAAFVYTRHGQLWLTARYLRDQDYLLLPDNARAIIDAVYHEAVQGEIPSALEHRDIEQEGKDQAARSQAGLSGLKLHEGYQTTLNQWLEDTIAPTRLSDPTITVRLARWDGNRLTPWYQHDQYPWDMSQLVIRKTKLSANAPFSAALQKAYDQLLATLSDKGKYSLLLPLQEIDGKWQTSALNRNGEIVRIVYDETIGFRIVPN